MYFQVELQTPKLDRDQGYKIVNKYIHNIILRHFKLQGLFILKQNRHQEILSRTVFLVHFNSIWTTNKVIDRSQEMPWFLKL